jgi:predicted TIM-barrel fold metal-dependent hydrolase
VDDVDEAVDALEACQDAGGVALPLFQHTDKRYDSPAYDRLWSALEDAGLPVVFHRGALRDVGVDPKPFDLALHRLGDADSLFEDITDVLEVSYARMALLAMLYSGTFQRHPNLRIFVAGFGDGWLPYTRARMDLQYQFRPERSGRDENDEGDAMAERHALAPERQGFNFPKGVLPSDHFDKYVQVLQVLNDNPQAGTGTDLSP